ncbi:Wzz/FepE/Etk N-terminal domain-containing protein [soil metagenome]
MKKSQSSFLSKPNLSLRDGAVVLFRHKWLILTTLLTAVIVTAFVVSITTDKYESRMKLLVKNMRADVQVTATNNDSVSDREVSESEINSEIELLKGRDLLEETVKRTNLANSSDGKAIEEAVYKLEKDLQISSVKKANIIEISYTSKSPETAALVLNQLAELYLEKHLKVHHPPGAFEFFQNQAKEYEQDLRQAESKFSNFQQQKGTVSITQQKELTIARLIETKSKLKDLEGMIAETDKRITALENQLGATDKRITTQNRVVPNQFSTERLNTMLVELRNRRIELLAKFQPTDRVVVEVNEQILATTEALQKASKTTANEETTDVNPIRQALETELSKAKIDQAGRISLRKNLSEQVIQYQDQLTKLTGATVIHDDLERQVKKNEETYQLYAKKEEESRIGDALDKQKISNVSIAESPIVPLLPNKNERLIVMILGLSIGLLFSFGSAFVSELLRETFYSPRELEAFAGVPVLATIPLHSAKKKRPHIEATEEMDEIDDYDLSEEILEDIDNEFREFYTNKGHFQYQKS